MRPGPGPASGKGPERDGADPPVVWADGRLRPRGVRGVPGGDTDPRPRVRSAWGSDGS